MKVTNQQLHATKAAAHNIRITLQTAIAAKLNSSIIDRLQVLSLEISAELDERAEAEKQ